MRQEIFLPHTFPTGYAQSVHRISTTRCSRPLKLVLVATLLTGRTGLAMLAENVSAQGRMSPSNGPMQPTPRQHGRFIMRIPAPRIFDELVRRSQSFTEVA